MIYLIIVLGVLWVTVSLLCVHNFNELCGSDDEFESLPISVQLLAIAVAPVLYIFWSR